VLSVQVEHTGIHCSHHLRGEWYWKEEVGIFTGLMVGVLSALRTSSCRNACMTLLGISVNKQKANRENLHL
jgi:hypothetical protein